MFGQKRSNASKEIGSLIGAGTTVSGDITFNKGLRVDGAVYGAVVSTDESAGGMLVVSEKGKIEGEVRAAHLVVAGTIVGPVFASELVELQPKARVTGDIHYRALEMHHGAVVEGQLVHQVGEAGAVLGAKAAPTGDHSGQADHGAGVHSSALLGSS